jgi:2'-5' RNA ligase
MNGLPAEMIDRWQDRAEPAPGECLIYWHMLVGTDPGVIALARAARRKLAPFTGLHMTPYVWLHITALIIGPASEISDEHIRQMATAARRRLADVPPVTVTVGKLLFHSEAIMLAAQPGEALLPVLEAVQEATQEATGRPRRAGSKLPWIPHITIAYSTARQSAEPIISAIARSLPERKVQISTVSVVNQRGPERAWDWDTKATVRLGKVDVSGTTDRA